MPKFIFQELDHSVIYIFFVYLIQQLTAIAQLKPVFSCIYILNAEHFLLLNILLFWQWLFKRFLTKQ